jgi:ATP-dependent DNA ligase
MTHPRTKAAFIEPMLLLRKEKLPEGPDWLYEIKLDGYRALAIKAGEKVQLRSRNDNDFNQRYPGIVKALASLPDETVIDGEVVALDEAGKPSFNTLQNYGSFAAQVFYFVFDMLVLAGRNVMCETLATRRALLEKRILPKLADPIRYSSELRSRLPDLIHSAKAQGSRAWWPSTGIASMSPGFGPVRGKRCESTRGRSSSSRATLRAIRISTL